MKEVHFIIQRQDHPDKEPYEEEFMIPYRPTMNVISALMELKHAPTPRTAYSPARKVYR
ncbi:hypothetical protein [Halobacillus halophilus]|uniref:hypothetical protein n=1 Tax=Halobacillus halophilus TaxID=1570 RepID=UPI001CD346D7|nr:hypothetical protein [Halobacillus halophilus]MCA1011995.1 hypothetical protein [Halobacillus halophilus]